MTNFSSFIANRINQVPVSGIRHFLGLTRKMLGVISLGIGEPNFGTPKADYRSIF
jgi:aminotransferase